MTPPPTDPPDVQAARAEINQPPPIDVAWLRTVPIERLPAESRRLVMLADTLAHLDTLTARLAVVEGERETWVCACGLPMSRNPHPDAGKPAALLDVGAVWVCIPCTVKSRHGATTARFQAERDRDAAAATERAAIVAWLRSDTAQEPGMHRPALDNAALRIEYRKHHEAP